MGIRIVGKYQSDLTMFSDMNLNTFAGWPFTAEINGKIYSISRVRYGQTIIMHPDMWKKFGDEIEKIYKFPPVVYHLEIRTVDTKTAGPTYVSSHNYNIETLPEDSVQCLLNTMLNIAPIEEWTYHLLEISDFDWNYDDYGK